MSALLRRVGHGMLAGTAGTMALNATTYADMLVRGRPPSDLPAQAAAQLGARVGLDLAGEDEKAQARREALGALLGYATGMAVGVAGSLLLGHERSGLLARGVVLGGAAMVTSAVPMTAEGLTDPRTWGVEGWLADIVPHAAYGFATAVALAALAPDARPRA